MSGQRTATEVERFLCERIATLLGLPPDEVSPGHHLVDDLFLDSIKIVELAGHLGEHLGVELDLALVYEVGTIEGLARLLVAPAPSASDAPARASRPELAIVVSATFTAEPVGEALSHWLTELGVPCAISFASYNQVFQELLDPASALRTNGTGVNIVLVRIEDWFHYDPAGFDPVRAEQHVVDLLAAVEVAADAAPLLFALCPHSPSTLWKPETREAIARLDERIRAGLDAMRGVQVVDALGLGERYTIEAGFDAEREALGHIPFTNETFAALGTELARKVHARLQPPLKVIVLDCDQTLWRGVCGEDGPHGVTIEPAHEALQRFMVTQWEGGKLLCLCSKNAEADVWAVFDAHPEMPLRREHFAATRISWQPKSVGLKELASELGFGLDALMLIDDNPVECAEVEARAPGVVTLTLPPALAGIERLLAHHWVFDVPRVTDEDRRRTQMVREERAREALRRDGGGFDAFLRGLELVVTIAPLVDVDLPRAAQLDARTNQFNATTQRRDEAALSNLLRSPEWDCFTVRVTDRFGDYGLVGLIAARCRPGELTLELDTFLLSCRVLGRRVEHEVVRFVADHASRKRRSKLALRLTPTPRNRPIRDFYDSLGAARIPADEGWVLELAVERIEDALARACTEPVVESEPSIQADERPGEIGLSSHQRKGSVLSAVASLRGDATEILRAVRSRRSPRPALEKPFVAPRSAWQRTIATLWCEVLRLERVGIHDSFFELGGDSLAAAEVLARLWSEGVPASVSLASMASPTVAGMEQMIIEAREGRAPRAATDPATLVEEARRADSITFSAPSSALRLSPKTMFLTGASGYFGAYLLKELLDRSDARILCHVRAPSAQDGRSRIEANLAKYQLWRPAYAERIEAIPGDLAQPLLGIGDAAFDRVAREADAVFHNGAWVNFILPYRVLAPANVVGTESVLRLMATGRAKALHFISTLGVLMSGGYEPGRVIRENDPLDHAEDLPNGYEQSKWVADAMVARAMTRGLGASIYRLGMLSGLSESGTYHKISEFLPSFLKGCLQLGSFPDLETKVEMVPVDFIARATVAIALDPNALGRVYQMNHPEALTARQFVATLRRLGYPLRTLPWEVWKRELMGSGARLRKNALYPFINFVATLRAEQTFMPEMDLGNFLGALEREGLGCPSQEQLLERYLRFFVTTGFIDTPVREAASHE